jgi:N-carbamoylputrescine amidase
VQRGHAIANGCYVAAPNRVGHEAPDGGPGLEFWGQSFVADPSGKLIAKGSLAEDEVVLADLDLSSIDVQRTHWPFLRDRRVDAYGELTKRFID